MIHPEAVLRLAALLTPLCLILSACVTAKATSAPACGDFLDKQGDKPAYIEYQGCHRNTKGRASRWWRVTGWTEPTRPKPRTSCAGATGSNPCTSCAAAGNRRRIPGWTKAMPGIWCSGPRKRWFPRVSNGRAYQASTFAWSSTRKILETTAVAASRRVMPGAGARTVAPGLPHLAGRTNNGRRLVAGARPRSAEPAFRPCLWRSPGRLFALARCGCLERPGGGS